MLSLPFALAGVAAETAVAMLIHLDHAWPPQRAEGRIPTLPSLPEQAAQASYSMRQSSDDAARAAQHGEGGSAQRTPMADDLVACSRNCASDERQTRRGP